MPKSEKQSSEMTKELGDIFSGKKVPGCKVVDYIAPEKKAELKKVLEVQKQIMNRTRIDWVRLNRFQVTI